MLESVKANQNKLLATNKSLEKTKTKFNNGHDEILIYGYGSDGMVSTSKDLLN